MANDPTDSLANIAVQHRTSRHRYRIDAQPGFIGLRLSHGDGRPDPARAVDSPPDVPRFARGAGDVRGLQGASPVAVLYWSSQIPHDHRSRGPADHRRPDMAGEPGAPRLRVG